MRYKKIYKYREFDNKNYEIRNFQKAKKWWVGGRDLDIFSKINHITSSIAIKNNFL